MILKYQLIRSNGSVVIENSINPEFSHKFDLPPGDYPCSGGVQLSSIRIDGICKPYEFSPEFELWWGVNKDQPEMRQMGKLKAWHFWCSMRLFTGADEQHLIENKPSVLTLEQWIETRKYVEDVTTIDSSFEQPGPGWIYNDSAVICFDKTRGCFWSVCGNQDVDSYTLEGAETWLYRQLYSS